MAGDIRVREAIVVAGAISVLVAPFAATGAETSVPVDAMAPTSPASESASSTRLAAPKALSARSSRAGSDEVSPGSPINRVVIVYQENHSFDDTLGAVCFHRPKPCNGYIGPVKFPNGARARNVIQPDIVPFVAHTKRAQLIALRGKWNKLHGCKRKPHICVSHVPPRRIPNLARLARKFAVSDATFASDPTASFGAHIAIAAGTMNGFLGDIPDPSKTGAPLGPGWGCVSNRDARWHPPGGEYRYVPSCVPDARDRGPYRPSRVKYQPTIMQRMEQKGLRWHIYQGHKQNEPKNGLWSVCPDFFWCTNHRFNLNWVSSSEDFVRTARAGRLPHLSMLMPVPADSQHNWHSMRYGDNYIGRMLRPVMRGPQWRHTAIFITYDDCGCFYDHVDPPRDLGFRNPMVIVSPWARRSYTDSRTAIQPYSMLTFLQHNFGLRHLTKNVSTAYDYRRSFNFDRRHPLPGVRMTESPLSAEKMARLAAIPNHVNDPT
jgi:phospholipase C